MLNLSAEQKDLKSLYLNDEKYIIPEFQRPYSWGEEQVTQLYDDLTDAFEEGKDFFLGNVILARSDNEKDSYYVIDGQQRIVTLWILMKVLALLLPSMKRLEEMYSLKSWIDSSLYPKIESNVIESSDYDRILEIFNWDESDVKSLKKKKLKESNLYLVAFVLYRSFSEFFSRLDEKSKTDFFAFLIRNVSLLPIELGGRTIDEATSKALTIFETINNRGLDLCDADIFKAKLYKMADNTGQKSDFSKWWSGLVHGCEEEKVSLDDLFRYYSRIIRGERNIVKSENRLREFYLNDEVSPFNGGEWIDIIKQLDSIVGILRTISNMSKEQSEVGTLCRILHLYSNKYPWSALVAFMYKHKDMITQDFINNELRDFLILLIRICYIEGSTTAVRIKIFDLIARVMNGRNYANIQDKIFDVSLVENPKGLRKGLVLLYSYLIDKKVTNITDVSLVRLFNRTDQHDYAEYLIDSKKEGSMANFILSDPSIPSEWGVDFVVAVSSSKLKAVSDAVECLLDPSQTALEKREKRMKSVLKEFFSGDEEYRNQ